MEGFSMIKHNNWQAIQNMVMAATGTSHEEYCNAQFEGAYKYLNHFIGGDNAGINILTKSTCFWLWWRNQWAIREQDFLMNDCTVINSTDALKRIWKSLHKAHNISAVPGKMVFDESYALMIAELFKENQKELASC
jgi:hypothetical protein